MATYIAHMALHGGGGATALFFFVVCVRVCVFPPLTSRLRSVWFVFSPLGGVSLQNAERSEVGR